MEAAQNNASTPGRKTRKKTAEEALVDGAETLKKICNTVVTQFEEEFIKAQKKNKKRNK